MSNKPVVLVIEDDIGIQNFIKATLIAHNYSPLTTNSGKEALTLCASHSPELILLDLGLPDVDGVSILQSIRQWSNVPILVVSARDNEHDKVEALDLGADDYITKPFGAAELMARLRAALRHIHLHANSSEIFTLKDLQIDYIKRLIHIEKTEVHLTPIEYKILTLLAQNSGKVLTHHFIIKHVWGPYASETQALRVNMANIRRKIEKNPGEPKYILTEVGVGYRMVESLS